MSTYSFMDVVATLTGPTGAVPLAAGAGPTEEGITITPAEDTNTMTIGADGSGMHTLIANRGGEIVVRLLRTSPVNAALMTMYNAQRRNSALHGQNVIVVNNIMAQDTISCRGVAFKRVPDLNYDRNGAMLEWRFDALKIDGNLGVNPGAFAGGPL